MKLFKQIICRQELKQNVHNDDFKNINSINL